MSDPAQVESLEFLATYGPLTTIEVGCYLLRESGSPSRILAVLASKGPTLRSNPENDRRATLHTLTQEGRAKAKKVRAHEAEFKATFAKTLGERFSDSGELNTLNIKLADLVSDPVLREALNLRFGIPGV